MRSPGDPSPPAPSPHNTSRTIVMIRRKHTPDSGTGHDVLALLASSRAFWSHCITRNPVLVCLTYSAESLP